jgi:hypothetical protein
MSASLSTMDLISASLMRRLVATGSALSWYRAFSASVSLIHAATILGSAPASRVARYPASFRSHSAILRADSSSSLVSVAASRSGTAARSWMVSFRRWGANSRAIHLSPRR